MLDAAEYLHLALHASQAGDHHAAMNYLKEALAQAPDNAAARYLLAAEHAELGLFDRAVAGMEEALQLAPELDTARFQLGLLYLQLNQPEAARSTFAALETRTADPAFRALSQAYQALIGEEVDKALVLLRDGILACDHNPALKADMERVFASVSERQQNPEPLASPLVEASNSAASAVFLGAYRDSDDPS